MNEVLQNATVGIREDISNFFLINWLLLKFYQFHLLVKAADQFSADMQIDQVIQFGYFAGVFGFDWD